MATRNISTKITLDNEKEFKQAISNINQSLGVLSSEMKKTSAEFQSDAKSVDALKAKGDVLERELLTQKEKLEAVKKALKNAEEQYGEADSRTLKWQQTLNETEASIYNTEAAIRENNKALDEANSTSVGLGDALSGVASKLGIDIPEGATEALNGMVKFNVGAVAAIGAVTAAAKALYDTYKKLIDMVTTSAASADNILTLSQIAGMDTQSIQELQYSAELIDVSFDTIKSSIVKLTNNMQSAADGTGDAADAFKALGVQITDSNGDLLDANEVFYSVIDALGNVENQTERNAYAMDIFGKSAEDLNPLIVQGSDALREYCEEAESVNAVLSTEQLEALGAVDDAYQRLQNTQEATRNQISAELAPAVEEFYTAWAKFCQEAGEALVDSGILDQLADILTEVAGLIEGVTTLSDDTVPNATEKLSPLKTALYEVSQVMASVRDLLNDINDIMHGDLISLWYDLGLGASSGKLNNYQSTLLKQQGATWVTSSGSTSISSWRSSNASGDQNFAGGYTWVGESGKELIQLPQGSRIYSAQESSHLSSGNTTYNITIDAKNVKEFNDIIAIVKNSRVSSRMRG